MIRREIPKGRVQSFSQVIDKVSEIAQRVRERGDTALRELTLELDGIKLDSLVLDKDYIDGRASELGDEMREAIDRVWVQLTSFHEIMRPPNVGGGNGKIKYGVIWTALNRVGIYVPGGKKTYPSTLMMAGIPARVAGVSELFVSTPVRNRLDPAIAYIAQKLKVKAIYPVGGAQAIVAMAFGTESVSKVDKIIGPGNIYVQAAKYLVSGEVGIDGIEGPTELVVIADDSSDPKRIALDLMAQGEHGSSSLLVLISDSERILDEVSKLLNEGNEYFLVKVKSLDEAIDIANEIAPEHLSLYSSRAREYLSKVKNSAAVTLGDTPPALIDYAAGPDHILPTNGWSRFRGGITVFDFLKPISHVDAEKADENLIRAAMKIAEYEGFSIHARSIGVRYE
ncbi:histidinol dehydrogenase [Metallosphaera cuprina]|uniref:Histidinol dehydrogenase n=1 Tax=Metallosphaera cuprina (strain Ar-4) TaxID=1006006 RepID=F4FZD6_METCR|nr:histidinol dehydrogenase [Metallosphaera cuprina]AEB94445.1 histidinol dehydrogenase [Metallosphaera cuprina Ar-4]